VSNSPRNLLRLEPQPVTSLLKKAWGVPARFRAPAPRAEDAQQVAASFGSIRISRTD
jgi:hypothetical protein